jgi:hypothetical protein
LGVAATPPPLATISLLNPVTGMLTSCALAAKVPTNSRETAIRNLLNFKLKLSLKRLLIERSESVESAKWFFILCDFYNCE